MSDEDCDDTFARLGETLAAVALLRLDATSIAGMGGGRHDTVQHLFKTAGIWARLRALYGVAHRNRRVWGAFPGELKDLRRFIAAPFARDIETSIESQGRVLLEKMTIAARQDVDERLYGRSQTTHAGWAKIWSLDEHTARQWRTHKGSHFRNLVAQLLRAERLRPESGRRRSNPRARPRAVSIRLKT